MENTPEIPAITLRPWNVGYRIKNRWEILDIKKGGMGIVYIVLDHEWNRKFALKSFQDQFLQNEDTVRRFLAEAEIWTALGRHTNIVYAEFVEKIEGKPVLFLEYIEGGDLSQCIGRLRIVEFLDFAIQFCSGMEYAYEKLGVIHRDIKPGNVMVQRDPRFCSGYCFKVSDFGLVKALGGKSKEMQFDVSTGLGTGAFMPPEQFPGEVRKMYSYLGNVTTKSDIYAFGVTLYLLLTRRLPFDTEAQVFMLSPVHPKILTPTIPEKLDALIMRCLEKDPDMRYANFTILKEELIALFHGLCPEPYVVIGKQEDLSDIDWLNRGVALNNLGKHRDAMACIEKALAMNRYEPRTWNDKGNTLVQMNQISDALACFDKALELYPEYVIAMCRKGIALAKIGTYHEAITWYDKALGIDPHYAEAQNHKGVALGSLGNHQEAIICYDNALKINPRDPTVLSNKGASLCALQRYDEAVLYFDRAVEINPRDPQVLTPKGMSLFGFGYYSEALDYFNRAIALDPTWYMAWYGKGVSLAALGKNQEAIQCLETHIERFPRELVQLGVTSTVQQARDIITHLKGSEAGNNIRTGLGTSPDVKGHTASSPVIDQTSLESWNKEAAYLISRQKFKEAVTVCEKILGVTEDDAIAWNNKGIALAHLGEFEKAIACHDSALEINPRDTHAWNNKGLDYAELGRFSETIRCYDHTLEINPDDALAWHNKGLALASLKKFMDAITCYDKALKIRLDYDMAFFSKGASLANIGEYSEALRCFEQFIQCAKPEHASMVKEAQQIILQLRGR